MRRAFTYGWRCFGVGVLLLVATCVWPTPGNLQPTSNPITCGSQLYWAAQTNTAVPPHAAFCGNWAKAPPPGQSTPPGDSPFGNCSGQPGCCMSKATHADGTPITALEKVEIRGKIVGIEPPEDGNHDHCSASQSQGYGDCDDNSLGIPEEYRLYVALDLDWDPSPCLPASVTPINSLAALVATINPANIVQLGWGQSFTTPSGWAMGGPGSLVVKVEIDGWLEGGRIRPPHDYGPAPTGWSPTANADQRVSWVFDPDNPPSESQYTGPLQPGDYVRLVGTRWEDGPHTSGGVGGCWNEGFTAGRGWIEMHPVDYMARITQVPRTGHGPYDANSWDVLTLCDNASVSGWEVIAPGPRPAPNATFGFEQQVIGDFTALAHLNPPLSVSTMLGDRIQVTVGAQNWNDGFLNLVSHRGRFLAFFRVFWNLPPPPPTPTVTLTLPCGGAVQITTDAPAIGPDGAPLAIVFRRGTSSGPGWTDLTSYGINSRTFLDQTFLGQPPPSGTLFYQVCVKDSALQESCGVAAIGISGTDPNEQLCNGVCTNLGSDSANCGGCGIYCPGNCTARQCTCPNGGTMCQNLNLICTDLISDPNNCGRCNNKCPGGHACVNSACASGCPAYAPDLCGGVCVDTTTDSNHCGSCTHRCPSGSYCDDSTCKRGIRQ